MNLEANKNEDAMKLLCSEVRKKLHKIYEGGGKKMCIRDSSTGCIKIVLG